MATLYTNLKPNLHVVEVSLLTLELAGLLHFLETILRTLLSLLAIVGVGDGGL
jgi:hypothetical protein